MSRINKKSLAIGAIVLLIMIAGAYYYVQNHQDSISYENVFPGIPVYQGAKVVQNQVKKDEIGNTQGLKTYVVADYGGDIDTAEKYMRDNLDTKKWSITENSNPTVDEKVNKKVRQFWIRPTSKKIESVVLLTLTMHEHKLFVSINAMFL